MTSARNSPTDQDVPGEEAFIAARILVKDFEEQAISYLATGGISIGLLKKACHLKRLKYRHVIAQDADSEDDTSSISSRRRTNSSNLRPSLTSSSLAIESSIGSGDGSSDIIWVMPGARPNLGAKTLMVARLPQSDYLIQANVVRDRLKVKPEQLPSNTMVHYNDGPILSSAKISLEWADSVEDLESARVQRSTFYVVDKLPHCEAVLSESDPQDSPVSPYGVSFARNTQNNSHGNSAITEMPPTFIPHGSEFKQAPYTHSVTGNSTATTAKQALSVGPGIGPGDQPQSTASDYLEILARNTSRNSVGSVSTSRTGLPGRQLPRSTTTVPPAQTDITSSFNVTILYGKAEMGLKLELNAQGEIFYKKLEQVIFKRSQRELSRESDEVRFTREPEDSDHCCWVSLQEDLVADDWERAVNWINRERKNAPCKIYGVIKLDNG